MGVKRTVEPAPAREPIRVVIPVGPVVAELGDPESPHVEITAGGLTTGRVTLRVHVDAANSRILSRWFARHARHLDESARRRRRVDTVIKRARASGPAKRAK